MLNFYLDLRYLKDINTISMVNVKSRNWSAIQFPICLMSLHMESSQKQFPYSKLVSAHKLRNMSPETSVTWCDHYSGGYYFFDHEEQRIVETEI